MGQISRRGRPTVKGWFAIRLGTAGLMVASAFVLMSAPAMACPVTDLTCLPETTADPVTAVVDTTTDVADTATTVVDQATEVIEQTTAAVEETAAAITDQANELVEPTTDEVLGSTVAQPSGPDATEPGGDGTATGPAGVKSRTVDGAGPLSFGRGPVIGPVAAPISLTPAVSQSIPRGGLFDRIGSLAIQAAEALAFPLALALIVLLFVAVQNRIDRKDPKLALAPVAPDLLRFE